MLFSNSIVIPEAASTEPANTYPHLDDMSALTPRPRNTLSAKSYTHIPFLRINRDTTFFLLSSY